MEVKKGMAETQEYKQTQDTAVNMQLKILLINMNTKDKLIPFHAKTPFLYLLKTPEILSLSTAFRGYKNVKRVKNTLKFLERSINLLYDYLLHLSFGSLQLSCSNDNCKNLESRF